MNRFFVVLIFQTSIVVIRGDVPSKQRCTNRPTYCGIGWHDNRCIAGYQCEETVDEISNLLAKVTRNLNWTTTIIIHDNCTAKLVDRLANLFSNETLTYIRYEIDINLSDDVIQTFLSGTYESFDDQDTINFYVICQIDCVERIVSQADIFDYTVKNFRKTAMRTKTRWVIVSDITDGGRRLATHISELDNVAIFKFKIDVKERVKFKDDTHWYTQMFDISTLYYTDKSRTFIPVGNQPETFKFTQTVFPNLNFGFNGKELTVTTLWWPPFVMKTVANNSTKYYGFCMDLLDHLAEQLNFTYTLVEPSDQQWGKLLKDGSWTGLIGQLQAREVDLMVAPASIQASREQAMDFTYPFYFDTSTFIMRRPDPVKTKWKLLLEPISWTVIVCIFTCMAITAVIAYYVEKYNPYYKRNVKNKPTWKEILSYVLRATLNQGGEKPDLSNTGMTVTIGWWLFTLLISTMYTAHLAAGRTVRIQTKLATFEELATQTNYKWGLIGGSYFVTLFQHSMNPTFQKIWQGIEGNRYSDPSILHQDPTVHVQKVLTEDYVFIGSKMYMEVRAANDCRIWLADEEFPNMKYGVGLPNNSPFTKWFSKKILEIIESGKPKAWRNKHWPQQSICEGLKVVNARTLTIIDMQGAFYVLLSGIFMGFVVILAEYIVNCIRNKRKELEQQQSHCAISDNDVLY